MSAKTFTLSVFIILLLVGVLLSACNPSLQSEEPTAANTATSTPAIPEWFHFNMTDVRTGETFTINDFTGKVVLIQTMAMWCLNCIFQQGEVKKLRLQLENPEELISISIDVDSHEDEASLKEYTEEFGFNWYFAVASLEVARALGNLYGANYLNPPLDPMLLIDRNGNTYNLPHGFKKVDALQKILEPYLSE